MFIPYFECDWITDRVKAGRNPLSADDVRALAEEGITHVLDLREPDEWLPPRVGQEALDEMAARGIVRLNVPVEDMSAPTFGDLSQAVAFIDQALEDPGARVFVHCRAGIERTACVLVAWRARRESQGYDAALRALCAKRDGLSPNFEQERVAREWIRRAAVG